MGFGVRLLACILMAAPLIMAEAAPSILKGEVSGFLKAANSPYTVQETIVVPEGKALVVEAGTVVDFAPGTGLDVQGGSVAFVGESGKPVILKSSNPDSYWNGISVTGQRSANFQYVYISNAEIGLAVENGIAELREVNFENVKEIGLYAKSASVDIHWGAFKNNKSVALWAANKSFVNVDATAFYQNGVAVVAGETSNLNLQLSNLAHNDCAILDMENNDFHQLRSKVEQNKVGLVSSDMPSDEFKNIVRGNAMDFSQALQSTVAALPAEPSNAYSERFRPVTQLVGAGSADSSWTVSGNLEVSGGYHHVMTRHNHSGEEYIMGSDTVAAGKRYKNYFQTPGFFTNWNAYLSMESPSGQLLEFSADISADKWNKFNPENVLAVYSDNMQRAAVGDIYLSAGEAYLAGVNILGGSYDLNLFNNRAGEPLFVLSAFGGESQKPKVVGERDEDIYNDYIEDGEGVPQELLVGGKIRWNMHRRFNGTLGFIGSKDFLEDPLLRDGMNDNVNTASPVVTSKTFFADGNWLFFPGDIELNGQVAIGAADTTNAELQRAINEVFVDAGLDASNFAKLRRLMANPNLVNRMDEGELEEFFGDNSMKTVSEMRQELIALLNAAKQVQQKYKSAEKSPSEVKNWDGQNYSVAASLRWAIGKTLINGHLAFIGADFYSAGSPDLRQNSREFGGSIDQKIFDFWKLNAGYELVVENASHGNKYNIFGLSEGTEWGFSFGAEDDWLEEHEQDDNRTLYDHTASLGNVFDVSKLLQISVNYSLNLRSRWTNQRLYADYSAASGIYNDSWFKPRNGKGTVKLLDGSDTLELDSLRWSDYYGLASEPFLATQFNERIAKHTWNLEFKFNLPKNVLKVGGVWTFRRDLSYFKQDGLMDDLDFSDETYGILGYYFHGADYFEQRYPVSLVTTLDGFRNMISVTPRYKLYNRDDMEDFEWKLIDNMTISLSKDFIDLSLAGAVRQEFMGRDEGAERINENESDYEGSLSLKFFHTQNLTTEWTVGSFISYRPDNRADEYKDIFGILTLNYMF